MATNLKLDEKLLEDVFKASGHKTKREAVTEAMTQYLQRKRQLDFLKLRGKVDFDPRYDYKEQRRLS